MKLSDTIYTWYDSCGFQDIMWSDRANMSISNISIADVFVVDNTSLLE